MIFDIHSHIVPGVDDGVQSVEEALTVLELAEKNGIGAVIATPHFYADTHKFSEYDRQVDESFCGVRSAYKGKIELYKGYEVKFFKGISQAEYIKRMTLNNSNFLLLELRYSKAITDDVVREIEDIYYNFRITPIMAHIERYHTYPGFQKILSLIDSGIAMAHVNASSFFNEYKRSAVNLLAEGLASVIATDMHSPESRPPKIKDAILCYHEIFGDKHLQRLSENNNRLYNQIVLK